MSTTGLTGPPKFIWSGHYQTWLEACAAGTVLDQAFVNDRWTARITDQLRGYRDARMQHGQALPPRPSNLPWVCAATGAHTVVDFGGSSGWAHDYAADALTAQRITAYVIVEVDGVAAYMRQSGLQRAPVHYARSDEPLGHFDILYCNSVLQYMPNNEPLLELVAKTTPGHVLLDDLLAKGERDFFSVQTYYEHAIPHRFLGLQQLRLDLEGAGYEMLLAAPSPSPVLGVLKPLPMENFPSELRVRYALSTLFRRMRR